MRLLRSLSALQETHGYLTPELLRDLAWREKVPLYRLEGLVSFYPHFRRSPPPRVELSVCRDMACWLAGGTACTARLKEELAALPDTEVHEVSCLGRCDRAPAGAIHVAAVSLQDLDQVIDWVAQPDMIPRPDRELPRAWRCDPYAEPTERYGVLPELLRDHASAGPRVLTALKESGLRGMGGAGFPTGAKWELVRDESRTPKYVICNADESEPGTFKDRVLLAQLPHLIIEGMLLAGLVVGADHGILYIRHEYDPERQAFEEALRHARGQGLLGADIEGSGFSFDIEIFVSPGGYILGEE